MVGSARGHSWDRIRDLKRVLARVYYRKAISLVGKVVSKEVLCISNFSKALAIRQGLFGRIQSADRSRLRQIVGLGPTILRVKHCFCTGLGFARLDFCDHP